MKRINIKLSTLENLTVDMSEDMELDQIFTELLQGKREYIRIGAIAISKDHIAYVQVQENDQSQQPGQPLEPPVEVREGDDQGPCCGDAEPIPEAIEPN